MYENESSCIIVLCANTAMKCNLCVCVFLNGGGDREC